jgi:6,7-dimethyl-8-ribityllumazine synthase
MSSNFRAKHAVDPEIDGRGVRVAIVCGRFNDHITERLLEGAYRGLQKAGVLEHRVSVSWVPGAFEIPMAAKAFATSREVDAVVCLGAVIRGETTHYDFVAGQCAQGIQQVQLETGVPVTFGVLTTEDLEQALARSEEAGGHNVGEESALAAVEMVGLVRRLRTPTHQHLG